MVEKSEDSITLRFTDPNGTHELVMPYAKCLELGIGSAGVVKRNDAHYVPFGVRSELVNGRPHRVLALTEVAVVDLGASDFDE